MWITVPEVLQASPGPGQKAPAGPAFLINFCPFSIFWAIADLFGNDLVFNIHSIVFNSLVPTLLNCFYTFVCYFFPKKFVTKIPGEIGPREDFYARNTSFTSYHKRFFLPTRAFKTIGTSLALTD